MSIEDEPRELCDLPEIDPPGLRRKKGRDIKWFSHWIEKEPVEKWSLLHDTLGSRHDIMITNLATSSIVEGVMHRTVRYLEERYQKVVLHMTNYN